MPNLIARTYKPEDFIPAIGLYLHNAKNRRILDEMKKNASKDLELEDNQCWTLGLLRREHPYGLYQTSLTILAMVGVAVGLGSAIGYGASKLIG